MTSPWANSITPSAGDGGDNNISLPNWSVPLVDAQGRLTRPWRQYIENGFRRMGGADALSNDVLTQLAQSPRPVFVGDETSGGGDDWPMPGPKGDQGQPGAPGPALAFLVDDSIDVASEVISFLGR
ncbi:MAG TPA: hypothetical protein VIN03_16710 [Roseateles sp.]